MSMGIYVCFHSFKQKCFKNKGYIPLFCGKDSINSKSNVLKDSEGDNIHEKNPDYSELTCLY